MAKSKSTHVQFVRRYKTFESITFGIGMRPRITKQTTAWDTITDKSAKAAVVCGCAVMCGVGGPPGVASPEPQKPKSGKGGDDDGGEGDKPEGGEGGDS